MTEDAIIRFDRVKFSYSDSTVPVLRNVTLSIPEGQLCLVIGPTGAGKSTLLQLVKGLVPHFTGGRLTGTVSIAGRLTSSHPPRKLADIVGMVGQDPAAGFITSRVDDELAYGMEQLGLPDTVMRTRIEEVIDLLGLEKLRHRPLAELSAGEQQRVAIGSVLTSHPRVLVLDEPTSALDPGGAEDVLAAILRLVHDLGITVLMAEHRLERVIQYADSILLVDSDGSVRSGDPATMVAASRLAPSIVELGRYAGWDPLPLSIRDARRVASPLRDRLRDRWPPSTARPTPAETPPTALTTKRLSVRYGAVRAVNDVDLTLFAGQVAALMGRNGSGKSSLLWALQGSGTRSGGTVTLSRTAETHHSVGSPDGIDPKTLPAKESIRWIALVPQTPTDLLYWDTVAAECRAADEAVDAIPGSTAQLLERLSPHVSPARHPRDLSEGERLALALAVQLVGQPHIVLLDEPTRGLDYEAKQRLSTVIRELAAHGTAVLLSSHDVEFVARASDRVLVMAGGELLTDGPVHQVLTASPSFAPQVARILSPLAVLTVDEVRAALAVDT